MLSTETNFSLAVTQPDKTLFVHSLSLSHSVSHTHTHTHTHTHRHKATTADDLRSESIAVQYMQTIASFANFKSTTFN